MTIGMIHRRQRTQGFTIVELLVAMAIAAIFFTSFFAVVATTLETLRTGDERTVAQQNARFAIQTVTAELRTAVELEPRAAYEASDPALPSLPRTDDANNPLTGATPDDGWPVLARSTDDSILGFIEMDHADANGGDEQYEDFRDDGRPFDTRPLSPNRLTVRLGNPQFYGNTAYQFLNPQTSGGTTNTWDLDDSSAPVGGTNDNPQSVSTIVTYEHQVTPPQVPVYDVLAGAPTVYDHLLDGLVKRLYVMNSTNPLILDTDAVNLAAGEAAERPSLTADLVPDYYFLRSFSTPQAPNIYTSGSPNVFAGSSVPTSLGAAPSGLGDTSRRGIGVFIPQVHLRQPVADHVIDLRFRYWTQVGGTWIEIRYDPQVARAGVGASAPNAPENGYYRYFDQTGNELYVWSIPGLGLIDVDETQYLADPQAYIDGYPADTLMCINEWEQGLLLFEGWRLVSAISVTVRTANDELLTEYYSTIDFNQDPLSPDFGLGFNDMSGRGANDSDGSLHQLWHGIDSHRGGYTDPVTNTVIGVGDTDSFDVVEPLANPNFEPTRFVTLQTMVAPPLMRDRAREFQEQFTLAFRVMKRFSE